MNITLTSLFASVFTFNNLYTDVNSAPIVYHGRTMNVIVPERPLAVGSFQLKSKSYINQLSDWQNDQKLESYDLIQRIVSVWNTKGIQDYLIVGKQSLTTQFHWEVVPFQKEGNRFWKQFSVLWKMVFGNGQLSDLERTTIAKNFQNENDLSSVSYFNQSPAEIGNDAFCKQEVINRQLVFEGKEINLLYNYAPIALGESKLHFLVVPKKHRKGFSDLTETEYLEAMQIVQKLVVFYKNKGYPIAYIFDKTGAEAGQTVPHWHEHVVFAATEKQEFLSKLTVLKNMIFGGSPLPQDELKTKVEALREELSETF